MNDITLYWGQYYGLADSYVMGRNKPQHIIVQKILMFKAEGAISKILT